MDVAAWLRSLGLAQYAETFRGNDVDAHVLPELTEPDLEKLGVSLGHRKRLLKAIVALRDATGEPGGAKPAMPAAAERRQLTVLFADLVGSTALSQRLDPEDMRDVLHAYQASVAGGVTRFGGQVAKYLGDGVLAYFGWPTAHEDDAERAVRAGLAIIQAVAARPMPHGATVAARVGIATGLTLAGDPIGEGPAQEQTVVGETPNLAARLQALAEPNSVVIGPSTRRLVAGVFELADLGAHDLKGFAAPVPAWRVIGPSAAHGRFAARETAGLTPLSGGSGSWRCCSIFGSRPSEAAAGSCCCPASPASASRASRGPSANVSRARRSRRSCTNARRTTSTARCGRSSIRSSEGRVSSEVTPRRLGSPSSRRCWPRQRRTVPERFRCSRRCWRCRPATGTRRWT